MIKSATIAVGIFVSTFLLGPVVATRPVLVQPAQTQQQSPEQVKEMMESMTSTMGKMMEVMMGTMFKTLAKPETAKNLAAFSRNYYDALIAKGFTKEEALRLVSSAGIPAAPKTQ